MALLKTFKYSWLLFLIVGLSACVSTRTHKKATAENAALTSKTADLEKQLQAAQAEKEALVMQNQESQAQFQQLVGQLSQEVEQGQLKVTQYKNMLTVDVAEKIFFDSGSATLKKTGNEVLKKVGTALGQYQDKIIRVVGHTDNVPIAKSSRNLFASNWELSVSRATNVVRFLQDESKIDPKILVAAGRGEFSPIAPNDTPENRQKNRRIEIMLLDKSMSEAISTQEN